MVSARSTASSTSCFSRRAVTWVRQGEGGDRGEMEEDREREQVREVTERERGREEMEGEREEGKGRGGRDREG